MKLDANKLATLKAKQPTIMSDIYGHNVECLLLRDHGMGTIDVERISDGRCFRISGLALKPSIDWDRYEARVAALESDGLTRSDAQGIADLEFGC